MEFKKFSKIARLSRDCIITEKIDGTNGQIFITNFLDTQYCYDIKLDENKEQKHYLPLDGDFIRNYCIDYIDNTYMFAGSRNRWITPEDDNYGFAKWVKENSNELFELGVGSHYGEWWGQGIQRKYDMDKKVFSLFNTYKWANSKSQYLLKGNQEFCPKCCDVVPVLYKGMFDTNRINETLHWLKNVGSTAAPGFMKPEGIVIFHSASGKLFKKTIENDEKPKSIIKE